MDLEKRRFTMIMWALCSFIVYYLILEFGWITTELSFWIYTAIYFVIFVVVIDLIMKPTKEEKRREIFLLVCGC